MANIQTSLSRLSLDDALSSRTVSALRTLAREYQIKGASKMAKPALVSAVAEAMLSSDILVQSLASLSDDEWALFLKAVDSNPPVQILPEECEPYHQLTSHCFLAADHTGAYCVPNEIAQACHQLIESGLLDNRSRGSLLNRYATAAVHLYGVISQFDFIALFNRQNEEKTDLSEITSVLSQRRNPDPNFCLWGNYLVNSDFKTNGFRDVDDLIRQIGSKPRYIPSKRELLKYSDSNYYEKTAQTAKLIHYLITELNVTPGLAEELVCTTSYMCTVEASTQQKLELFSESGISFSSTQLNDLVRLITEVSNNSRLWANNGHTPNELRKLFEQSRVSPVHIQNTPKKKIGRNEPCPCGSVKKYKKCCLGKIRLM